MAVYEYFLKMLMQMKRLSVLSGLAVLAMLLASVMDSPQPVLVRPVSACCYDPPEPAIVPDPVAPGVAADAGSDNTDTQAEPASDVAALTAGTDAGTDFDTDTESGHAEQTGPRQPLYSNALLQARRALDDDQNLKARQIVNEALQRYGTAPELALILAEIDRKIGLRPEPVSGQGPAVHRRIFKGLAASPPPPVSAAQKQLDYAEKLSQAAGIYGRSD